MFVCGTSAGALAVEPGQSIQLEYKLSSYGPNYNELFKISQADAFFFYVGGLLDL